MRKNIVFCLRNCGWLALFATLMMWAGTDRPKPSDSWLILPGGGGAITATTTRRDLVARYGAANVVDQDIDVGEGNSEPGTILFPNDPQRRIEILWKDDSTKLAPRFLAIYGKSSLWNTVHGISLGTSLKELEKLNGHPFSVAVGTDQTGWVFSWDGGTLDKEVKSRGVDISLDDRNSLSSQSSDPVMQKTNPRVDGIHWNFP
jgi:hypothetical protein